MSGKAARMFRLHQAMPERMPPSMATKARVELGLSTAKRCPDPKPDSFRRRAMRLVVRQASR